jgi:starvation-inducible DNA-binding protein
VIERLFTKKPKSSLKEECVDMEMNTGMTDQNRNEIAGSLSRFLADTYAVYLKTQNFHWNLVGPAFYALHLLFEKQYEEMAEAVDEIAERVRALGFYVDASFSGFKELTTIKDEDKVISQVEMIEHLIKAHETLIRHGRNLCALADKERDFGSVDLLGRRLIAHEKMLWMLRSQE